MSNSVTRAQVMVNATPEQRARLKAICERTRIPQQSLLREALDALLKNTSAREVTAKRAPQESRKARRRSGNPSAEERLKALPKRTARDVLEALSQMVQTVADMQCELGASEEGLAAAADALVFEHIRDSKTKRLSLLAADALLRSSNSRFIQATLAEIEGARAALSERAAGKASQQMIRARELIARLPAVLKRYEATIQSGAKALSDPQAAAAAREAMRKLLARGRVVFTPDRERAGGTLRFGVVSIGEHILEMAGIRRKVRHLEALESPAVPVK